MQFDITEFRARLEHLASGIAYSIKKFFTTLSDRGITAFWIAAIIIAGLLIGGLTTKSRAEALQTSVNRALKASKNVYTLEEPISSFKMKGSASMLGRWFIVTDGRKNNNVLVGLVFTSFETGSAAPALAICSTGHNPVIIRLDGKEKSKRNAGIAGYSALFQRRLEKASASVLESIGKKEGR
jgi:hypothetical protein